MISAKILRQPTNGNRRSQHVVWALCGWLNLGGLPCSPVQDRLAALADAKGVELSALVDDLLRKHLKRIEAAR